MRRREFIAGLGAAAAWPVAARAQLIERTRRIGILMSTAEGDPEGQARVKALLQQLGDLGWSNGGNLQVEVRWGANNADRSRGYAEDLFSLGPDLLVANATSALVAAQQATRTIPTVFVQVADPVRGGFVANLARPGGNVTGFTSFEDTLGGKWLELLKQVAPQTTRALIMRNAAADSGTGSLMPAIEATAPSLGIQLAYANVRDGSEIERAIQSLAGTSGTGIVPVADALFTVNRKQMIALAAEQHFPAVYYFRFFAADGGLVSYGPDTIEIYRQAAAYIDRILKGASPAELPVQNPTKHELVLNLKTAKALGLEIPPTLLARADEVIE